MDKAQETSYLELVQDLQKERSQSIPLERVPHILLPYQIKWHQDLAPVRVAEKSRRIGWTWGGMAAEAALEAAQKGTDGCDQFYIGFNLAMAAEFIGDAAFFAKAYGLAVSKISVGLEKTIIGNEDKDIVKYSIKFASGYKIEALSSKPRSFRSRQGHARIDEAAFHENLSEIIKAALAFIMWGGRVDIVSTHDGVENDFNLLCSEIRAGKLPYSLHKCTFDDALRDGFYERVCLVRGLPYSKHAEEHYRAEIYHQYGEGALEELDCIPRYGSGAYIPRILLERCQSPDIPVLRWSKPLEWVTNEHRLDETQWWINDVLKPVLDNLPHYRTVLGQDFGRTGDLSVIWVLQQVGAGKWRTGFILELRRIPFDVQQKILFALIDDLPLFHHAKFDARGNGQSHAEAALQRYGAVRIECVMATPQWYAEHFPKYRNAYEDKSIIIPNSEDVIADHRRVILDKGKPKMDDKRDKGSDGEYRHGDSAIAGVLAWAATQQEGQPAWGETVHDSGERQTYLPDSLLHKIHRLLCRF